MVQSLSLDLRRRVYTTIMEDQWCRSADRQFHISATSAVRIQQRYMQTQSLEASKQGRSVGYGKLGPFHSEILAKVVACSLMRPASKPV